jgi:uncharacterized lipoprotein YddW (UPF0748 family)
LITLSLFFAAPSNYSQARPLAPVGVRAVWVRPFINADEATRRSPGNGRMFIQRELQRIKRAGFDTVYVESFFDGYTIYPSSVATQRPLEIKYGVAFRDSEGRARSWDVLQAYLDEGRALGLNIHAWFQVFFAWHTGLGPVERSPIFGTHSEWLALDKSGSPLVSAEAEGAGKEIKKVFMSPSHPGVQRFLVKLVNEVCLRYPQLGGIQLDYIRYPTHTPEAPFDYNLDALNRFRRATGLDARRLSQTGTPADWLRWEQWKTGQVTSVVRELSKTIRAVRPSLIISAAVFPDFAQDLRVKMQDTREWSRLGLIDALLPMLYSEDYVRVDSWAREFREGIGRRTRVYPALYIGHFYNPQLGSFDSRYLELKTKYEFEGVGLFAAQLLTDDLVERLAATRLNQGKSDK